MSEPRWLLLGHQLPTRSSNARVKTWRRLQHLGAVPARNSMYVLPNTEPCREDFEWVRMEIVALGGEATVFAADAISEGGNDDIVAIFRRLREQEYRTLKTEVDKLMRNATGKSRKSAVAEHLGARTLRALRDKFIAIERIDFFDAPGRAETAAALSALEKTRHGRRAVPSVMQQSPSAVGYRGRRWVTRPRPGVDRMASAWLIRRFVDPDAAFAFVDRPRGNDVPFDMYTGEFSHHDDACTFEVIAKQFRLQSVGVVKIGHIVHDLDMKETRFRLPETAAVGRMVEGLRELHADDGHLLEQGIAMFEALARSFESDESRLRSSRGVGPGAVRAKRNRHK